MDLSREVLSRLLLSLAFQPHGDQGSRLPQERARSELGILSIAFEENGRSQLEAYLTCPTAHMSRNCLPPICVRCWYDFMHPILVQCISLVLRKTNCCLRGHAMYISLRRMVVWCLASNLLLLSLVVTAHSRAFKYQIPIQQLSQLLIG